MTQDSELPLRFDSPNLPKITVVTPSFNQAKYLETTILSVLGQYYPNLEYIVMDGGSNDGSMEIIQRYADRLAHWQSAKDRGQSDAINQGFARATGDILCWVNSDDFFLPGTLWKIVRLLGSQVGHPALVFGSCLYFREADGAARVLKSRPFDPELLRETDYIYQPSSFWTKALWDVNGPLDETLHFGFDWDWYIRATAHCDFLPQEEILSGYRRHEGHKSGSGGGKRREEVLKVVRRHGSPAQIAAYEYAAAKYDDFEKLHRTVRRLRNWHVPYSATVGTWLVPGLWSRPGKFSRAQFDRCMGMLASG